MEANVVNCFDQFGRQAMDFFVVCCIFDICIQCDFFLSQNFFGADSLNVHAADSIFRTGGKKYGEWNQNFDTDERAAKI